MDANLYKEDEIYLPLVNASTKALMQIKGKIESRQNVTFEDE